MNDTVSCPLCQSRRGVELQRTAPIEHHDSTVESEFAAPGDTIQFYGCLHCGLIFRLPRPSADFLARYYSDVLPPQIPGIIRRLGATEEQAASRTERRFRDEFRRLQRFVGTRRGHVLDVGGGRGESLVPWLEAGWRTTLVDLGVKQRPAVHPAITELSSLAAADGACAPADVMLSFHCLEHALDLKAAFRELRAASKPGSLWAIEVPLELPYIRGLLGPKGLIQPQVNAEHLNFFTPQSLRWAAQSIGLRVLGVVLDVVLYWFGPSVVLRLYGNDARRAPVIAADAFPSERAFRSYLRWRLIVWRRIGGLKFRAFRYRHREYL